jgi:hypothetical protein
VDDVSVGFVELVALTRITPDSTVEKFGSLINSSFFDASNILATLKQKGLVDFVTAFPSQSTLKVTDRGNAFLAEVTARTTEPIDQLDLAILSQLAAGVRILADLGSALNVAQRDLAIHIYKLAAQQDITYELVNASISMYLTEKGFVAVKNAAPQQQMASPTVSPSAAYAPAQEQPVPGAPAGKGIEDEIKVLEEMSRKRKRARKFILVGVVVFAIVVVLLVLVEFNLVALPASV